jgi:phosphoserine phosphatase
MIIAFDFDGTLTDKDTLLGFFLRSKTKFRAIKILLYLFFACLCKVKIISNNSLKDFGVKLFLNGKSRTEINEIGEAYGRSISLNKIYDEYFKPLTGNALIISASFHEYLKFIFPDDDVVASSLSYNESDKVTGVAFNCYKEQKLIALHKKDIRQIDVFYTDNIVADGPLVNISSTTVIVKSGSVRDKLYAK